VLFAIEAGAKAEVEATESKRTIILLRDMVTRHTDKIKLWSCVQASDYYFGKLEDRLKIISRLETRDSTCFVYTLRQ
jgi:hypothetical protein